MADAEHDWGPASWASVTAAQRRAWLRTSPDERLAWLEDALTFAAEAGALDRDRRRRAEAARQWDGDGRDGPA